MADTPVSPADLRDAAALLVASLGDGVDVVTHDGPRHGTPDAVMARVTLRPRAMDREHTRRPSAQLRLVRYDPSRLATEGPRTVWVLRRATPTLRQSLRAHGQSFIDLAGAVHLRLPWLVVDRTDIRHWRPPLVKAPLAIDPFGDRTSRIVRTVLAEHLDGREPRSWGVRELAAAAGVDRTTTSKVLRRLAAWRVMRVERHGRSVATTLLDAPRLIDRWGASYDWTRNAALAVHAPVGDPRRFLARLPASLEHRRWALTLQAGASLLAPHAAWDRIHLYVDVDKPQELADVARGAGWRPGTDGTVVLLRPFYRTTVWDGLQHVRRLPVVSTVQLLVDLWQYPVRGREQAEHLLEVQARAARALASRERDPPTDGS